MKCENCKHLIIQNGYEPKCMKGGIPFYIGDCSLFENIEKMTNREWINSLSNEDFVDWLLGENDFNWLLVGPDGFDFNKKVPTPNAPHLKTILKSNTSSKDELLKWLNEERS